MTKNFLKTDWQLNNNNHYNILIPFKVHGITNPTCTVYQNNTAVGIEIQTTVGNDVILGTNIPFDGKVVIR